LPKVIRNTRDYFIISRGQRNGMLILLTSLFLTILLYFTLPLLILPDAASNTDFERNVRLFLASPANESAPQRQLNPFPFDPNTTTLDGFLELGLSDRQAEMIIRYRNSGGVFKTTEDFGKIYSISEEEFNILRPYVNIPQEVRTSKPDYAESQKKPEPFPFDPNTIDSAGMSKLGLNRGQIRNIINFRDKGGKFVIKKDFGKLFTISESDYAALEKFILLPSVDTVKHNQPLPVKVIIVEINRADTAELRQIKGIGPAFSDRIVNYRNKLGGFFDKSQLLEVFGMDTARFAQISPNIEVDRSLIRKINLNRAGYKDMLAHPYLENYIVKAIFEYKETKGKFRSVEELKNIQLIYPQLYQKIEHYFTVEENYTSK